ncbi:10 TM acyl transferase domain found in Cas1p-domain-containing protein [Ilyonectria sp. MPI-CAGE-AT-0026]|nr:10 TM acyl transferase domain found in Cas1p-domain-containing protein [Ilyonectria sp. MPI-CAGE-AT-0026]
MKATIVRILPILWAVLLLAAVAYRAVASDNDPYRCRAALETGQWIDHPDENGDRMPFKQWQPDGCLFHQYTSADIRQCMEGRSILFSGDSTTREVVYGLGRLLDRDKAVEYHEERLLTDRKFGVKGTYIFRGIHVLYSMNAWFETTGEKWEPVVEQLELFRDESKNHVPMADQKSPALLVMGGGPWFTNPKGDTVALKQTFASNLSSLSELLGSRPDFATAPMDPLDGIGNQFFFAPPALPIYTGNVEKLLKKINVSRPQIADYRQYLRENADGFNFPLAWAIPRLELDQNQTIADIASLGWHAIDIVAEAKANIYLNLRCNAKLDRQKGYPYNRTCCTDYGNRSTVQQTLLVLGLLYLVGCVLCETWDLVTRRNSPCSRLLNMETGSFVMALLMCYYADRTQMMAKGDKLWSYTAFSLLCIPCIVIALATIRKTRESQPKPEVLLVEVDSLFLSREQTDEWKGWSQCVIMVYQWTGAERSPILYIFVRLLVAAYLFHTGYGHTTFFLTKKDYSLRRVAAVFLRLNLLTCSLAYFMNTEYMFYYFSPLASFWFIVIYVTMAVGHRSWHHNVQLILVKICVSAVVVAFVVLGSPLTEWTFAVLRALFKIEWSLKEWEFRVSLDLFIVYIGMLAAVANFTTEKALNLALRYSVALVAFVIMLGYWFTYSTKLDSMGDYRLWHPYTSFVPILAFIAIRNATSPLRNCSSKAMAWLGRCSLEVYALQSHILLAADTEGVLVIDAFKGDGSLTDRWRSLIFIVPVFLWISSRTAKATGNLVNIILDTKPRPETIDGVQLSDMQEKNHDDPSDDDHNEHLLDSPDSTLHHTDNRSAESLLSSLPARLIVILLVMWFLNLLSPSLARLPIPDGITSNDLPPPTTHNQGNTEA